MPTSYSYADILAAYKAVGVAPGRTVYLLSAMWQLAGYDAGQEKLVQAHFDAIRELLGHGGTIAVPTGTNNLCNTSTPFDLERTPGFNHGQLSEYVRLQPGARRSFHPFNSYAAIGVHADEIVAGVSRQSFGPETPEARLLDLDAIQINIGLPPNINTTVTHVEQVMAVPYRYTKEFLHPVVRSGEIRTEPFYMFVRRLDVDVERSHCKPLFARFGGRLRIDSAALGRGKIYSYSMRGFFREASRIFAEDIYAWCERPPEQRPFRK